MVCARVARAACCCACSTRGCAPGQRLHRGRAALLNSQLSFRRGSARSRARALTSASCCMRAHVASWLVFIRSVSVSCQSAASEHEHDSARTQPPVVEDAAVTTRNTARACAWQSAASSCRWPRHRAPRPQPRTQHTRHALMNFSVSSRSRRNPRTLSVKPGCFPAASTHCEPREDSAAREQKQASSSRAHGSGRAPEPRAQWQGLERLRTQRQRAAGLVRTQRPHRCASFPNPPGSFALSGRTPLSNRGWGQTEAQAFRARVRGCACVHVGAWVGWRGGAPSSGECAPRATLRWPKDLCVRVRAWGWAACALRGANPRACQGSATHLVFRSENSSLDADPGAARDGQRAPSSGQRRAAAPAGGAHSGEIVWARHETLTRQKAKGKADSRQATRQRPGLGAPPRITVAAPAVRPRVAPPITRGWQKPPAKRTTSQEDDKPVL